MSREHIEHNHIQDYADRVVNLKPEDAKAYRYQVNRLRDKLSNFLKDNPDFELKKMLLSGSLAKYTALKSINDIDVAIYVDSAPDDVGELTDWLAEKLRNAFPEFQPRTSRSAELFGKSRVSWNRTGCGRRAGIR